MIDIVIVSSYLLITLLAGIYNRSKSSSLSGYSKIGNDINSNRLILTATIFASAVGGGTTFGITEKAFGHNLSFAYGLLLTIPIDLMIARYLVPRMTIYNNVSSIGEIVGKFYGDNARIITGIAAALISIGYLSVQISVSGRIFSFILGIDYVKAVIISYAIVIFYTTIGGLRSIVINNSIQFLAMIFAIPMVTIFGIYHVGFHEFFNGIPEAKYNLMTENNLLLHTIYATLSFSVMGFYPSFIQRILIGKTAKPITEAIYLKTFIYALFIVCLSLNGLLALEITPDSLHKHSLTSLIDAIIPVGLKGFIVIGLLASVMSTADSDLNISAISIVNDILRPLGVTRSERNLLIATKILSVLIGSSAILIVMKFESLVELIIFSAGLWAPVIVVPLIGILYNKIISRLGFYCCSFLGATTFIGFETIGNNPAISGIFAGVMASLVCFLGFYFCEIITSSRGATTKL